MTVPTTEAETHLLAYFREVVRGVGRDVDMMCCLLDELTEAVDAHASSRTAAGMSAGMVGIGNAALLKGILEWLQQTVLDPYVCAPPPRAPALPASGIRAELSVLQDGTSPPPPAQSHVVRLLYGVSACLLEARARGGAASAAAANGYGYGGGGGGGSSGRTVDVRYAIQAMPVRLLPAALRCVAACHHSLVSYAASAAAAARTGTTSPSQGNRTEEESIDTDTGTQATCVTQHLLDALGLSRLLAAPLELPHTSVMDELMAFQYSDAQRTAGQPHPHSHSPPYTDLNKLALITSTPAFTPTPVSLLLRAAGSGLDARASSCLRSSPEHWRSSGREKRHQCREQHEH